MKKNLIDEKNGIINIYSFFLKAISKNFKVDDLYKNITKYIQNYLIDNETNINENDLILLNKFKENNKTKIVTNSNMIEEISKKQDKLFNNFPGSIHFNISNPNIQKMNKVKFFLFLKESNLMNKWKIRNDNVKDLSSLVDVFGPFIIESNLVDKLWQINFSYLSSFLLY